MTDPIRRELRLLNVADVAVLGGDGVQLAGIVWAGTVYLNDGGNYVWPVVVFVLGIVVALCGRLLKRRVARAVHARLEET